LPPSAPLPPLIDQIIIASPDSGGGLNIVTTVNPLTGEREILDGIVGQNIIVTTVNPLTGEMEIVDGVAGYSKSGDKIGVCK
jgi:hypothetical protein